MSEEEFTELLRDLLEENLEAFDQDGDECRLRVSSFKQHGLLTSNRGLVVRVGDKEFQLTVVRSR